jgi:tetratricopeptide (TPR) repeat protein
MAQRVPQDLWLRLRQFDRARGRTVRTFASGSAELPLEDLLKRGARWQRAEGGSYLRRDLPLGSTKGPDELLPREAWRRLGGKPEPGDGPWFALDTETTGLEGGAGTLVFLVGWVQWCASKCQLTQFFLPEPAAEESMLRAIVAELARAGAFLSYNGRGFDLPRLRNRLRMHRMDDAILDRPHLDLLPPCRRLVRSWLGDARLGSVERGLLGKSRDEDLPGSEAPRVYRALLADRVDQGIGRVLEHNAHDVRTLLELGAWLAHRHLLPPDPALPASAQVQLGRALARHGALREAEICFLAAWEEKDESAARRAAWEMYRQQRRLRDHRRAARWLAKALERWPAWIEAHVEFAKLSEHQLRDLPLAERHAREALRLQQLRRALGRSAEPPTHEELVHRLRRILSKKDRGGELGASN